MMGKLIVAGVVVLMSMVLFGCQSKMEEENTITENVVIEESSIYENPIEGAGIAEIINESGSESATGDVDVYLGTSAIYTEEQLLEAISLIEDAFEVDFAQCTLQEIVYDEEYSLSFEEMSKEMFQVENAVVFTSTFVVADEYMNGPLNAGAVYEDYEWTLTVDADGNWSILTSGY